MKDCPTEERRAVAQDVNLSIIHGRVMRGVGPFFDGPASAVQDAGIELITTRVEGVTGPVSQGSARSRLLCSGLSGTVSFGVPLIDFSGLPTQDVSATVFFGNVTDGAPLIRTNSGFSGRVLVFAANVVIDAPGLIVVNSGAEPRGAFLDRTSISHDDDTSDDDDSGDTPVFAFTEDCTRSGCGAAYLLSGAWVLGALGLRRRRRHP